MEPDAVMDDTLRAALHRLVRRMRNHLWLVIAGRWFTAALWVTVGLLLALGVLHFFVLSIPLAWSLGVGLSPVVAAIAGVLLLRRPTTLRAARQLDRGINAHSLLLTTWDLSMEYRTARGTEALLLARAATRMEEWRAATGRMASPEWPRSLPLAATAGLGVWMLLLLPGASVQSSPQLTATPSISSPTSPATTLLELARQSGRNAVTQPPQKSGPASVGASSATDREHTAGSPGDYHRPPDSGEDTDQTIGPSGLSATARSTTSPDAASRAFGADGGDQAGDATRQPAPVFEPVTDMQLAVELVALHRTETTNASATGAGGKLAALQSATVDTTDPPLLPAAIAPIVSRDRVVHSPALRAYLSRYFQSVRNEDSP